MNNKPKARVLAYYLPQFHPIPENDKWWGKGFTEWTNVGKARALFPGHYQPHVPANLGYYDLRVPETRKAQADLAREYGIEGFIYWHYWFGNGKRLLTRPFQEVLSSGEPDFPFALAWANETWSGTFHGLKEGETLIEQTYPGDDDYREHFYAVLPAFKDKRYITCEGKPMFFVYLAENVPNMKRFITIWQELALANGLPGIYFVAHQQFLWTEKDALSYLNPRLEEGFSAINIVNKYNIQGNSFPLFFRILKKVFNQYLKILPIIKPYNINEMKTPLCSNNEIIPSSIPNWDHTPRSGIKGMVLINSTPEKFKLSLQDTFNQIQNKDLDHRIIVIKSWNEWAEGNYLEPDLKYGTQYLEVVKSVVMSND